MGILHLKSTRKGNLEHPFLSGGVPEILIIFQWARSPRYQYRFRQNNVLNLFNCGFRQLPQTNFVPSYKYRTFIHGSSLEGEWMCLTKPLTYRTVFNRSR